MIYKYMHIDSYYGYKTTSLGEKTSNHMQKLGLRFIK